MKKISPYVVSTWVLSIICVVFLFLIVRIYFPAGLDMGGGYSRDLWSVYYQKEKIPDTNAYSFRLLQDDFASDGRRLLYRGKVIPNSDPASFEVLGGNYYRDKNNVYHFHTSIVNADPKSFERLSQEYGKDKRRVYYMGKSIEDADPETVEVLDEELQVIRDKNGVYRYGAMMSVPDSRGCIEFGTQIGQEFHVYQKYRNDEVSGKLVFLGNGFYRVGNRLCNGEEEFLGDDPDTFEILSDGYSRDNLHIFYGSYRMRNVEEESFQVLKDGYARNKRSIFFHTRLIFSDADSFKVLEKGYAQDARNMYFEGDVVGKVDTGFRITGEGEAESDYYLYKGADSVYVGDWRLISGDPFDACNRPVFEGLLPVEGWYAYEQDYIGKSWVFHISYAKEDKRFPYGLPGSGRGFSFVVENMTPEVEKKLKSSSSSHPVKFIIEKISYYCEGVPRIEVSLP